MRPNDPELVALQPAAEGTAAFLRDLLSDAPDFHEQSVEDARAGIPGFPEPPVLDHGITRSIPGPGGEIPLRIFAPENPVGIYLHLHGGGWVIGSAMTSDTALDALATGANVVVVSVEYRLAPEHPYPAPLDDCEAAARWVLANAEAEWGVTGMVIGGESAGGHLTATTALRLRDSGDYDSVKGLNLVYGAFDLSMTPSQFGADDALLIPTKTMQWFYGHFLQNDEDTKDPAVSPLYANLDGMGPALFTVGTSDPLRDDTLFMAARWEAAGNDAKVDIYPDAFHGFTVVPSPVADEANKRAIDFIAGSF